MSDAGGNANTRERAPHGARRSQDGHLEVLGRFDSQAPGGPGPRFLVGSPTLGGGRGGLGSCLARTYQPHAESA